MKFIFWRSFFNLQHNTLFITNFLTFSWNNIHWALNLCLSKNNSFAYSFMCIEKNWFSEVQLVYNHFSILSYLLVFYYSSIQKLLSIKFLKTAKNISFYWYKITLECQVFQPKEINCYYNWDKIISVFILMTSETLIDFLFPFFKL